MTTATTIIGEVLCLALMFVAFFLLKAESAYEKQHGPGTYSARVQPVPFPFRGRRWRVLHRLLKSRIGDDLPLLAGLATTLIALLLIFKP